VDQLHNLSMSSRSILGPRLPGIVIGTVSNINDPENLGRIKVRLPWLGDSYETDWASIATPMTGASMGFFFIPSVNDEVLVAFDHGDVNRPFVLGCIWNTKDKPPGTSADALDNIFRLKTKKGNELIFDDKTDKVEISMASGHRITVGPEKIEIVDKGQDSIVLDSQAKSVQIQSKNTLSIKATTIEMEATSSMKLKAAMMSVEGSSMLDVKSSGIANIKGSLVKIN
jgi:uncharacterized protein involved in type VI secretion and phage assembly